MTLEESIQRYSEIEKKHRQFALDYARVHVWDTANVFKSSADEHKQLAEWLTELKNRRTADTNMKPIVHAWWIDNDGMYTCSACGSEYGVMMNYCGGCGCRMDGDSP